MSLKTAYALPYRVVWSQAPLMSVGQDVRVRVTLQQDATAEAVDALDALVTPFELLASSGALAGAAIAPWATALGGKEGPYATGPSVEWTLRECLLDERSITVLAQMFLSVHDAAPIAAVSFYGQQVHVSTHELQMKAPTADAYPAAYRDPGFVVKVDSELGREVLVRASFASPTTAAHEQGIGAELFAWAAGLLSGAYGVAPFQPDRCVAVVDDNVVHVRAELTWSFTRFQAHPAAFAGLTNVFVRISERVLPVVELSIE